MLHARYAVPVLLAALATAGCEKKTSVPEDRAVLSSYEAILFVPDPDLNALVAHAAWLGPDALPPVIKAVADSSTNDAKRAKLARLLETLAWNGFRSKESVGTLGGLSRDRNAPVRRIAIDALYASGADLSKMDGYWDPAEVASEHPTNPAVAMRLPFDTCRTRLAQLGVPIPKGPDGAVAGDPGRHPEAQPPVKEAASALHRCWSKEPDTFLRIACAIAALRLGDQSSAEPLIPVLAPAPAGTKPSASADANRDRALRALKESTGQTYATYEEWSRWWDSVKPKAGPAPRTITRPDGSAPFGPTPVHPSGPPRPDQNHGNEPPASPPGTEPK